MTDLAYQNELMANELADNYVNIFMARTFHANCRLFTNGGFYDRSDDKSWTPVEGSKIDTGVVCTDGTLIGIMWIGDED